MENVLILGGGGVIGSSLIKKIMNPNINIISIDKTEHQHISHKNAECHIIDLVDRANLPLLEKYILKADIIFFKIAILGNPKFSANHDMVYKFIDVNTLIFLSIVKMIVNSNAKHVIIDSSIAAISNIRKSTNMKENQYNFGAMNYYGLSKLLLEDIINFYFKDCQKSTWVFRYPRVFSIDVKNVIHNFVEGIVKNKQVVIMGNPNRCFDFVHINDVINANEKIIYMNKKAGLKYCHITPGGSFSLINLIAIIKSTLNISEDINIIYKNDKKIVNEPIQNNLSMNDTRRIFGFEAQKKINHMILEVYSNIII